MFVSNRASNRHFIFLFVTFFLFIFSSSLYAESDLDDVRAAIVAKGARWYAGETSVSKLPPEQRIMRTGLIKPKSSKDVLPPSSESSDVPQVLGVPASLDWRSYSKVTPVRDQGNCGSCWAFATTAALESQALIAGSPADLDLAEQILVSCSSAGNCIGGYTGIASNYIRDVGLPAEVYFPYTATNNQCSSAVEDWQNSIHAITGWRYITTTNPTEDLLKNALNAYGPLVTTMEVYSDFYHYTSGVYSMATGAYEGGHAILLIGYDDSAQCFIAKNSWGTGWGESGYFRIAYSQLTSAIQFGYWTIAYEQYRTVSVPEGPRRLFWVNNSGAVSLWTLSSSDEYLGSRSFGPYAGWRPVSYHLNQDGNGRMLWTHESGTVGLWMLDSTNSRSDTNTWGPIPGWTPISYQRNTSGMGRIFWGHVSGAAAVWTLDSSDNPVISNMYGPYNGWRPVNYHLKSDGNGRMLWMHTSGTASLWMLDSSNNLSNSTTWGPFPGWTATDYQSKSDGTARVLWVNSPAGMATLWTLDSSDNLVNFKVFGPYQGWTAVDYGNKADGSGSLLWTTNSGMATLWTLDSSDSVSNFKVFGPYPGWTAVDQE